MPRDGHDFPDADDADEAAFRVSNGLRAIVHAMRIGAVQLSPDATEALKLACREWLDLDGEERPRPAA